MKTGKYCFRRVLAILMSFTLLISSLELTAFAEGVTPESPDAYAGEEILFSGTDDEEILSSGAEASQQEDSLPDHEFPDGDQGTGEDGEIEEAVDDELSDPALMSASVSTWEDLQSAIDRASDGDVITLTKSVTAPDARSVLTFGMGTDVTLDLQGYTIDKKMDSPGYDGYVLWVMNGNVTIKGNSGFITGGKCSQKGGGIYVDRGSTLTLESGVIVTGNTAGMGGGIYVEQNAVLTIAGGEVLYNTAELNGGGVYVEDGGSLTISSGSIMNNDAEWGGGGVYMNGGTATISGGSIKQNSAGGGAGPGSGIYLNDNASVNLEGGSVITIAENEGDNIYMPDGSFFNVNSVPSDGSSIHVYLKARPAPNAPVTIARSDTDCSSCFIVDYRPDNTEIVWDPLEHEVVLMRPNAVLTWEELQNALDDGGTWEFAEPENIYVVRLDRDITAGSNDTALKFQYYGHPVILDLCGHTIDRGLTSPSSDGNVLTVEAGELILRDSVGGGKLTGGYNLDDSGSGVAVYDGTFTMEGGSITGNTIENVNGAGVYLRGGTFNLKGGSITGNTAIYCEGGGIYMTGGTFNVSGGPTVTDNVTTFGSPGSGVMNSNIYLSSGNVISFADALTDGASLYVNASGEGTITSGYRDFHSDTDPAAWFRADDESSNLYCDPDGEIALERGHDDKEVWTWSGDCASATLEMSCSNCGRVLWQEQTAAVDGPAYNAENNVFVFTARVTHDQTAYTDTAEVPFSEDMYVPPAEPYVDEDGGYVFGTREHFELTLGGRTYYFETEDGHPGAVITEDPDFMFSYFMVSGQALEKYVGPFRTGTDDGTGAGTTSIELPKTWTQTLSGTEDPVTLDTLGSGTSGFFEDESGEMTVPAGAGVEITDRGSITRIRTGAFAGCSGLTLTLSAAGEITIESGAFTGCSDVTLNLGNAVPVTIEDGAFTGCSGVTIITGHDSGLTQGGHDDSAGTYTVVVEDGHTYTPAAVWADDYSCAELTLTCTCGDTQVIGSDAVTVTRTEKEDHAFSFTASGEYEGETYTVTLENVPSFCVTISGGSETSPESLYLPQAQGQDYAVFTVTQEMMEGMTVPPGAVLSGVKNGSQTYNAGDTVYIRADTALDAVWTSTWGAVREALQGTQQEDPEEGQEDPEEGQEEDPQTDQVTVYLYNNIQAGEDDQPLVVPSGRTANLILRGYTVDRNLSTAVDDGYAIRVDGTLYINSDPDTRTPEESMTGGTVRGGKNTGCGGGIYVSGSGILKALNMTINGNTSGADGGGIYIEGGGRADLTGCTITYNRAAEKGGGVLVGGTTSQAIDDNNKSQGSDSQEKSRSRSLSGDTDYSLSLDSTTIEHNYAKYGGGIFVLGAAGLGGYVLLKNKTSVINNRNLDGSQFNNLDVGPDVPDPSSVFKVDEGVTELTVGVPSAAAGGAASGMPVWAKALIAAGITAVGTAVIAIIVDSTCSGEEDTQKKTDCNHPAWKTVSTEWEEQHYDYVEEYRECTVCHKAEYEKHIPEKSVDATSQVTKYIVVLSDGTTQERDVNPYTVILKPGIDGLEDDIFETILLPHGRNEGASSGLPNAAPWTFTEGYQFDGWILGSSTITQVDFKPGDGDDQTKTIVGRWKVSITYVSGALTDLLVIGKAPNDPNPTWVTPGTQHELLGNTWQQYFLGFDSEGNEIRSYYRFDGWDVSVGVRFIDRFTPEYIYETVTASPGRMPGENIGPVTFPIKIRARWKSPWKMLDEILRESGSWKLTENVYATQKDTAITVTAGTGAEKVLDLNGFKAHAWLLSLTQNPFNVDGRFRVKDTSEDKNGCISGGKSATGVGGVMVKSGASFTLESGNIRDNSNIPSYPLKECDPDGGGVYVKNSGAFVMEGGSIRDNTAAGSGGGVYVKENGTFKMTGGEITGNKVRFRIREAPDDYNHKLSSCLGGGVYVDGTFQVSGKVIIQDNEVSEKTGDEKTTASNVYLPSGKKIEVIGKLDESSRIGVSMAVPGVITSGLNAGGGSDARGNAGNFVSDDPDYMVIINGDGEAELAAKCVITFKKGDDSATDLDDDGKELMPADEVERGTAYELPDCRFGAPAGKVFKEWSVMTGGADAVSRQPHNTIDVTADTTVTAVWTDGPLFRKQSLLLTGLIGVNIFMELPGDPDQYEGSFMTFKVKGSDTETVTFNRQFRDNTERYYRFTGHINSIQMAEPITCTFHYGEGGGRTVSTTVTASVYISRCAAEYAAYPKVAALLEALGNYGHYVQPFLSAARGWKIGTDYREMPLIPGDYEITSEMIADIKTETGSFALSTTKDPSSATRLSYSLNLESGTLIYVYIRPEEGKTVTATLDGTETTAEKIDGGYYFVTVPGIAAHNLGKSHTINVTVKNETTDTEDPDIETFSITLNALSYVNTILNPPSGYYSQQAKEAVTALFNYYKAAAAYRENE